MEDPDGRNWVVDFLGLTSSPHPRLKWSLKDENPPHPLYTTELWQESVYLEVLGPARMEMNNFRLSYTLLHIKMNLVLRPYRLIRRHNFAHKKELSLAYIVAFNYSFFLSSLWVSEGDSLGLSQPCSGQSVSAWVTACGTISCPAAQQECQGERESWGWGRKQSHARRRGCSSPRAIWK